MRSISVLIGSVFLITAPGFSEVLTTAADYAVDSDVVLESAVKEIKSIPRDTIDVVGDVVKYVKDETITAANGVKAVFQKDIHEGEQRSSQLAIGNAWDSSNDIKFRSYKVNEDMGALLLTGATVTEGVSVDVSGFFEGIEFPKKCSAYYQPKFNRLYVRQTQENILAIENVVAEYQDAQRELLGHQVEIETKFVEVSQTTLNELGFKWSFTSKNGGDLNLLDNLQLTAGTDLLSSGLRSTATALSSGTSAGVVKVAKTTGSLQWEMYISALEQAEDSDILCAPRVVTRDGTTAIIQVGEEQMLPKSFDINSSDVSPFIEHADWDLTLTGVYMEVTPEIREEGLIDLELNPKIMDILGYDTYTASEYYEIYTKEDKPMTALEASLPYMRIREMTTRLTVADGSTVGMGGLIYDKLETYRDKVPVLGSIPLIGRLFRSEGEKSVKRNLMIFVTATQVDVDGRRSADLALKK
jgi:general secretion pathway protein D